MGHGHGASAIRVGELQEDPLTRLLLRCDEFETGGELTDGKGKRIKMGKDSEPLRSGKGRALNVKVAQETQAVSDATISTRIRRAPPKGARHTDGHERGGMHQQ